MTFTQKFTALLLCLTAFLFIFAQSSTAAEYIVLSPSGPMPKVDKRFQGLRGGVVFEERGMLRTLRNSYPDSIIERSKPVYLAEDTWGRDRLDQRLLPLDGIYKPAFAERGGEGVLVYTFDTGAYSGHNDYRGRVLPGKDYWGDYNGTEDCDGHGTHVASTILGSNYGLAPRAKLVPVRVVNCLRWASTTLLIEGIGWMIKHHKNSPAVANISLRTDRSEALEYALGESMKNGILPVAAAGNTAESACSIYPAGIKNILTVGATNYRDSRAGFSNWGECVDLFAPGEGILGADITAPDSTRYRSGTSMAAPHGAGAVAVLLGQYPRLRPEQIINLLIQNSTKGILSDIKEGSPNRLLWMGPGEDFFDPGASNDYFSQAKPLQGCVRENNTLASQEQGEPAHGGKGYSLWYRIETPVARKYFLRTSESKIKTRIAAYRGDKLTNLKKVGYRENKKGLWEYSLVLNALPGVSYKIAVDALSEGSFVLCERSAR